MSRTMLPTPERMVVDGRVAAFGHFARPFRTVNVLEADVLGVGALGARLLNRFRLKEWEHFAVFGPDFLLAFVVFDAHYLGNSFAYFVDRRTGRKVEHHREGPSFVVQVGDALWDERCRFRMPGYAVDLHNHLDAGRHTAKVEIRARADAPGISAELEFLSDLEACQPLDVVLRLGPNRPAYSHKLVCPAAGRIRVGDAVFEVDPRRDLVAVDVHKAYYPYRMHWDWATCGGFDDRGRVVGLNLTRNVIEDDADNNENGLWVGNRLSMFGAARFTFDPERILAPWHVETVDGRCRVDFHPLGERAGRIDAGVVASDYHQPYGTFTGEAVDDDGVTHVIRDFFGVTEHHVARF